MKSRTVFTCFAATLPLLLCLFSTATAYTINDTTKVTPGLSNSVGTPSSPYNVPVDAIPVGDTSNYQIYGIDAQVTNGILGLSIYTNVPSGGYPSDGSYSADLAIDVNLDGVYEYGVAFRNHGAVSSGNLYSVSSWNTSYTYWEPKSNWIYGETWNNPYKGTENPVVGIAGVNGYLGSTGLSRNGSGANPDWQVNLGIDLALLGISPGGSGTIGLFLASADCANDIIYGEIDVSNVPLPGAAWLLGAGFVGLVGVRRGARRKKKIRS